MSDGHATADHELSTSDTAVPSRGDKTHVLEPNAATIVPEDSTRRGDSAAAVNRLNQSAAFTTTGTDLTDCNCGYSVLSKIVGSWSVQGLVPNLSYVDQTDDCETDQAAADDSPSCIDLDVSAIEEGETP